VFEGFVEERVDGDGCEVFVRHCGQGPAVLLLHGHPRTSSTWHHVAPQLVARGLTVVCADLPGYGRSGKPTPTADHGAHSKRTGARQLLGAMRALGHERFAVVGHDRGSYYALRMALDHPGHVTRAALLDCLPISEHLDRTDARFATAWWHWFFFAQPKLPERVIIANPDAWYRGDPEVMGPENYAEWRAAVHDPDVIRGMLEDYRAGLGIDAEHERADRAAGRRVQQPLLVLWSSKDDLEELYGDPLQIWRGWAHNVTGHGIVSGHHVAEQAPDELAEALGSFLTACAPCPDSPEASPGSVRELLLRFFQAENERDWDTYGACLALDVEWVCYGAPERSVVRGREAYLAAMQRAYTGWKSTFDIDRLVVDEEQGLAYAELVIDGRRSVDAFEVTDGLIAREREYFDDEYWTRNGR